MLNAKKRFTSFLPIHGVIAQKGKATAANSIKQNIPVKQVASHSGLVSVLICLKHLCKVIRDIKVEQNKIGIIIILMRFERHFLIHMPITKSKEHFNKEHIYQPLFPVFPLTESISVLSCFMVGVQLLWPHYVSKVFRSN